MLSRLIAAKWAEQQGLKPHAFEGDYTFDELLDLNVQGYNVYVFPNYPSEESYAKIPVNPNSRSGRKMPVTGEYVDVFNYVFIDLDMKDYNTGQAKSHNYANKQEFIDKIQNSGLLPTRIVDSGGGVHVYWKVTDLDSKAFLRLTRRLARFFNTDYAVGTLNQLMRLPGTLNVKNEDNFRLCETLFEDISKVYDSETLHKFLPPISAEDEKFCETHYNSAHSVASDIDQISEELPIKFLKLCQSNTEAKALFYGHQRDRSSADFRLGHLMYAAGLSKEEAIIPLMQTSKSSERTKNHRYSYADNIVNKIWVELETKSDKPVFKFMSKSISELTDIKDDNPRFPCHPIIDATEHGFRLTEVLGLIGGQGNGKSSVSLNMFMWFIERNPEYTHLYVSLEQPIKEIETKWKKMTGHMMSGMHDKVHILGNYNDDGTFRNLSLEDIQEYIIGFEKHTGQKIGCVCIDHIGVLKQERKSDEISGLIGVCKQLKVFSISTKTFLIIQSQTTRSKNGGGDMELDIDAAFGTSNFENFVDYVFTTWQPLKRIYKRAPNMTITAFKLCKNRHKNVLTDKMQADQVYALKFEPDTDRLREMTSDEHRSYEFWQQQATALRNKDKKKEPSQVVIIDWVPKLRLV